MKEEVGIMTHTHAVGPAPQPRNTILSWFAVVALPFLLVGGFILGSFLVGDPNTADAHHGWDGAWRVLVLWGALEVIPLLGIWFGARGVRHHEPSALVALIANAVVFVFFVGVTLIGGLSDALG
jgi:hypothetical protein